MAEKTKYKLLLEKIGEPLCKIFENLSLENIDGEIWKPIKGYEGRYEISNMGRVKSLKRIVHRKNNSQSIIPEIIKKQRFNPWGYLCIFISINKVYQHIFIHVLVAQHFIPNPKKQVNHKNAIKQDNRASNLEWCTPSQNLKHAFSLGLMCQKGEFHASNKLNNNQVIDIFYSKERTVELAIKYNVCTGTISNIKGRRNWTHITKDLK